MKKVITLASASLLLAACSGEPSKGNIQDANENFANEFLKDGPFFGHIDKWDINIKSVSGCEDPVEGKYKCTFDIHTKMIDKDGKLMKEGSGEETRVFYKEDGEWKILLENPFE